MGKLGTDLAAIDFSQECEYVTELHAAVAGARKAAGEVFLLHVGFCQAEIIQLQNAWYRPILQFQGIQVGYLMSPQAVHLNQAGHRRLFFLGCRDAGRRNGSGLAVSLAGSCPLKQPLADGGMSNLRLAVAKRPEIAPPALGHGVRFCHELLIQGLDRGGIAAKQWR